MPNAYTEFDSWHVYRRRLGLTALQCDIEDALEEEQREKLMAKELEDTLKDWAIAVSA